MVTRRKADVVHIRREKPRTLEGAMAVLLDGLLEKLETIAWPAVRWRDDPVGFGVDVLDLRQLPELEHQVEILEAVRDHDLVAVKSGQKIGKTLTDIVAALWWYATRVDARVILTATTAPQIERVLWRELRKVHRAAGRVDDAGVRHGLALDGLLGDTARTGLKAADFREVLGFTAREVEAVAGVSGANILYIGDEASSLSQEIFEAMVGNMAAGSSERSACKMLLTSNPTRAEGPFFDVFHHKKGELAKGGWKTLEYSSEEIAAKLAAKGLRIPGIASATWIERQAESEGRDSVFFRVRVLGEFILNEAGKAIPLELILAAQDRYEETGAGGLTSIGLDPAGPGAGGDDTVFTVVRGLKELEALVFRSLDEDAIVAHLKELVAKHRQDGEIPIVILDIEGPIGSSLFYRLKPMSDALVARTPREAFRVFGVKSSAPADREPLVYNRKREELYAGLRDWLRKGGAILRDHNLEVELHAPEWQSLTSGKLKLSDKDDIRKAIGRSPDRADSLALAVYNPAPWLAAIVEERKEMKERARPERRDQYEAARTFEGFYDAGSPFEPKEGR